MSKNISLCLTNLSIFQVKKSQIPWEKLPSNLSDNCFDMLKGCLQTSARHRINLKTLAAHPWLQMDSWKTDWPYMGMLPYLVKTTLPSRVEL